METIAKFLMIAGLGLALVGGAIWLLARAGFRGLPGDIHYESDGTSIHFPIVTCLVISIIATVVLWIIQWLRNR